ncbi:H-type lectin domain-containing protein [Streptomyces bacillaris]|uniref:H-type lectin domain-containing protein n=1 Tax=Streptomyces bacillaris TaxID=68179 RepID=UPI00363FE0EE
MAAAPVSLSGTGATGDPVRIGLSYDGETGCDAIAACVGDHLDAPLTYDGVTGQLGVRTSADPGNLVQAGSDGGLFVPTAGASAGLVEGDGVDITGDQASGYTISARISADPRNGLAIGSDGGLYVRGREIEQAVTDISFTNQTSHTRAITFATPFSAPPVISIGIQSGAGPTARWDVRAINVTTTGFTIFAYYGELPLVSSTWSNIPVAWRAEIP